MDHLMNSRSELFKQFDDTLETKSRILKDSQALVLQAYYLHYLYVFILLVLLFWGIAQVLFLDFSEFPFNIQYTILFQLIIFLILFPRVTS
jgi:hypothetical protein